MEMIDIDKISVIIPVYNVEPYIRRCLDSVISQTYTNLEILCVNDGSTDNSGKICDEYALMDRRIRVIHKDNGGLSSALNVGLKNHTGRYVGFTDSDDWLEPEMFEVLHNIVTANNAMVGVVNYFMATDTKSIAMINGLQIPGGSIPQRDMLLYIFKRDSYKGFSSSVCNRLFCAEFLRNSEIAFDESIGFGMDTLFNALIALEENCTGAYSDRAMYHYYQRGTSITNNKPLRNISDTFKIYGAIIDAIEKSTYSDISIWVKRFYCYYASLYAEMALSAGNSEILVDMQDKINKYLSEYIETNKEYPDRIGRIYNCLSLRISE